MNIGDPLSPESLMGPLIDSGAVKDYENAIKEAVSEGGEILYGGKVLNESSGFFVQPTIVKAQNNYTKKCFKEYGMITDKSGNYSSIWRPYHYIGLELAQSIYSIALDKKSTGSTKFFNAEVIAVAKKDLNIGDILDGEGGFAARGKLISSRDSIGNKFLPLGLSDGATIKKEIKKDDVIKMNDVNINWNPEVLKAREYQINLIKKDLN